MFRLSARLLRRWFWSTAIFLFSVATILYFLILFHLHSDGHSPGKFEKSLAIVAVLRGQTVMLSGEKACQHHPAEDNGRGNTSNKKSHNSGEDVFLFIVVCSVAENAIEREVIRESWGRVDTRRSSVSKPNVSSKILPKNVAKVAHGRQSRTHVRIFFLIGQTSNTTLPLIDRENELNRDLIQGDFPDSHETNTLLKTLAMLEWVSSTCRHVRYVMKTDDSTFVNVPRLVSLLRRRPRENLLLGSLMCGQVRAEHQLELPVDDDRSYYHYLSGSGYVISGDLVPRLHAVAMELPYYDREDVFVTGICAKELGVRPVGHKDFHHEVRLQNKCLFQNVITGSGMTSSEMRAVWRMSKVRREVCEKERTDPLDNEYLECSQPYVDVQQIKLENKKIVKTRLIHF